MAKETITRLKDDMNGTGKGVETVIFSHDGFHYEIDLGLGNRNRLAKVLRPFIEKARPVSTRTVLENDRETAASIRQWAHQQGYDIGLRGRIKQEIVDAYNKFYGYDDTHIAKDA